MGRSSSLGSLSRSLKHVYAAWAQRLPCYLRTSALLGSLPCCLTDCCCCCLAGHLPLQPALPCPLADCQEFPRTLIATSQHSVASDKATKKYHLTAPSLHLLCVLESVCVCVFVALAEVQHYAAAVALVTHSSLKSIENCLKCATIVHRSD